MTLIYEGDLDSLNKYLHSKNEVKFVGQCFQKLEYNQDRYTRQN